MLDNSVKLFSDLAQLADEWPLTYRLNLPKNPEIVVAGAYQGKLIRLLAALYPEYVGIVGYEPQIWAFKRCIFNTLDYKRVHVQGYGLLDGPGEKAMEMGEFGTDACSVLETTREHGLGIFKDAAKELQAWLPIDLLVLNVEGYEYKLLPYLIDKKLMATIDRVAVQFHMKYQDGSEPYILEEMHRMYDLVYSDYPRWMYWVAR